MAKTTDEAVLELLRKVDAKKKEIEAATKRPQWRTNCTIGYNPEITTDRVNIMTVKEVTRLIDLYAFLCQREEYIQLAGKELNYDVQSVYMGYSIADWKEDIKDRFNQLMVIKKKEELDLLDKRVNSLVTPEQRREMELQALQSILE